MVAGVDDVSGDFLPISRCRVLAPFPFENGHLFLFPIKKSKKKKKKKKFFNFF